MTRASASAASSGCQRLSVAAIGGSATAAPPSDRICNNG